MRAVGSLYRRHFWRITMVLRQLGMSFREAPESSFSGDRLVDALQEAGWAGCLRRNEITPA
jgi:hypothetical protein